jgi:transposase-like protein
MKVFDLYNSCIPDENFAMNFFRKIHWANGVYCPKCRSFEVKKKGKQGRVNRYACKSCENNFSDFSDTIFYKSRVPMGVMLYILLNLNNKSIKQLSDELNYNRSTISRIANIFRENLLKKHENHQLEDEIEIDEMYVSTGDKGIKKTFLVKEDSKKEEEEHTN